MRTIFFNVDTQVDFIDPKGKLPIPNAESIKPNLKKITDFAKNNFIKVINTMDCHTEKDKEISDKPDFINTFPQHCMVGTEGLKFIPETDLRGYFFIPVENFIVDEDAKYSIQEFRNIVIEKNQFNVFTGNPYTEEILKILKPKEIIVYGVAGNVCVDFAVRGLRERGYFVIVISDAIQNLPNLPDPIIDWENLGIKFMTTEELVYLNV